MSTYTRSWKTAWVLEEESMFFVIGACVLFFVVNMLFYGLVADAKAHFSRKA